jgi:hypothetical protein
VDAPDVIDRPLNRHRGFNSGLYCSASPGNSFVTVMDQFWSICTMPIGVALCFGPGLIVWWLTRDPEPLDDKADSH